MRIEYDRHACAGWFQCVQKWEAFDPNPAEEKAHLDGAEEAGTDVLVRDVPANAESAARRRPNPARSMPSPSTRTGSRSSRNCK